MNDQHGRRHQPEPSGSPAVATRPERGYDKKCTFDGDNSQETKTTKNGKIEARKEEKRSRGAEQKEEKTCLDPELADEKT